MSDKVNAEANGPIINKECPCKECTIERYEACHASCEKYIEWRKILDTNNHCRWKEEQRYIISDTKRRWLIKNMRRKRK